MAYIRGKKLLVISYHWSLGSGPGFARTLKFAKYLDGLGWASTVITPAAGAYAPGEIRDPGAPRDARAIETGYRDVLKRARPGSGGADLSKNNNARKRAARPKLVLFMRNTARELLTIPDETRGWYKPALKRIEELLKSESFDAVYSTSPPETAHLIARAVKLKYGIPWLADLRDPWGQSHYSRQSFFKSVISGGVEKYALGKADAIVTISPSCAETLKQNHPRLKNRIFSVTNSFDADEIKGYPPRESENFIISYTGKIHREHQDPEPFFKALAAALGKGIIDSRRVKVRFYTFGYYTPDLKGMIASYGLDGVVDVFGRVSRGESLKKQAESTALLFIDWKKDRSPYSRGVCPHKMFEYMGAKKPILVISEAGNEASGILASYGAAKFARGEKEIENTLAGWFREFREKRTVECSPKREALEKYTAGFTASKLAEILNGISEKDAGPVSFGKLRIKEMVREAEKKVPFVQPWPKHFRLRATELERLLSIYSPPRAGRVLEIGCGNAIQSAILSGYAGYTVATDLAACDKKSHSIGLEKAKTLLEALGIKNCALCASGAERLPFAGESFDAVFSAYVLEHVKDRPLAVGEIARVLKKGGLAIFVLPNFMERVFYFPFHYVYLLRRFFARLEKTVYENSAVKKNTGRKRVAGKEKLRLLFPEPHGEYGSYFEEIFLSTPGRWLALFRESRLEITDTFSSMLIPWHILGIVNSELPLYAYERSGRFDRALGKTRPFKWLGNNFCVVAKKI